MMSMRDRVAIVTGGGGAIGRAICLKLAGEGARIAVFDLVGDAAAKVADEVRGRGGDTEGFAVDVSQYGAVEAAVGGARRRFGRIDILVNCAGGSARGKMTEFHRQSMEVIHGILHVNLFGALHCIHAVVPHMLEAGRGAIVNIASVVARGGRKHTTEYGASKGGIIAATKSLAIELGPHNITVNCVSPGKVEREAPKDQAAFARRYSVMNRVCTQDDVARAVLFFAQPEADLITGQDLAVDGGRSLGLRGDD